MRQLSGRKPLETPLQPRRNFPCRGSFLSKKKKARVPNNPASIAASPKAGKECGGLPPPSPRPYSGPLQGPPLPHALRSHLGVSCFASRHESSLPKRQVLAEEKPVLRKTVCS